ncbi:CbtB-domain containing protein [Pseudooceanicola sp. 216_PA32_1]|uniref:CbtB-domain containing protein n=1 Tax=Pseudooceanicola pacificus TaxID=2676438 RepID=A0A844WB12_9RHOB|nr:CbtB domain-containing protein [Pseudooceanicola pacificus]MWB76400.1 CbtB-domain containing protein [Pseudooceanicola pacificus]
MTALSKSAGLVRTEILGIAAVFALGLGIVTLAGHVQAATLHDAAHDTRHATGFPCH